MVKLTPKSKALGCLANIIEDYLEKNNMEVTEENIKNVPITNQDFYHCAAKHDFYIKDKTKKEAYIEDARNIAFTRKLTYQVEEELRKQGLGHLFPSEEEAKEIDRKIR